MKINKICLNCNKKQLSGIDFSSNYTFFLFRTPVTFRTGGEKTTFREASAAIFSTGNRPEFISAYGNTVKFDYVSFQITQIDRQYMESMNIPLNSPVQITNDIVISNTLKSMQSEYEQTGRHHIEFMELSMRIIFIALCEISVRKKNMPDIPHYSRLKAVRNAIFTEPMKQWSVDDICYNLNISRTYFHRLYREAFGVTCIQDVIRSRIDYACELLKNTDLSISEISEKCGYDNDSYFMRQFRQYKYCTPSEYRQKIRNE